MSGRFLVSAEYIQLIQAGQLPGTDLPDKKQAGFRNGKGWLFSFCNHINFKLAPL